MNYYSEWSQDSYMDILMKFKENGTFVDIGANIGNWTLANISKTDKIVAVEASLFTYSKLLDNIESYSNI